MMFKASTPQPFLLAVRQNDYLSLAILTAVVYDYVLVFPKEVQYIWGKPWTWVSTSYILVRYCGLYNVAFNVLYGSSFVPGPTKVCETWGIFGGWSYLLFIGAADFVMILRIWAMYNRSRTILGVLLILFLIEVIPIVVVSAVYSGLKDKPWVAITILNVSFCAARFASLTMTEVSDILQMIFALVLCMFAIVQFVKQSIEMYRTINQWQLNQYISLLTKQGILYFFSIFLLNINSLLHDLGKIPLPGNVWQFILADIVQLVPVYTLTPRFIIGIREMYARDVQDRCGGGIDTGFGLSTLSTGRCSGIAGEPVVFNTSMQGDSEIVDNVEPEDGQNEGGEESEIEVPRETWPA